MPATRHFNTPVIVISRCIEFDAVRYNGDMISSHEIAVMKPFVRFIPVCPEVEIGLGIPRATIRIVRTHETDHLIQPSTGEDITQKMNTFCAGFLDDLPLIEGCILKNKSPTSGISGVNIYPSAEKSAPIGKDAGFFGRMVLNKYPGYPIEDEGRLRNTRIREHFLTRIFMLADLKQVSESPSIKKLSRFHTENKLMFMAHSQTMLRRLGIIAANNAGLSPQDVIKQYRDILIDGTRIPPRYTSHINVLLHAFGYLSDHLSIDEKAFFLDRIEDYRRGTLPVIAIKTIIQAWILRYNTEYLKNQTYFAPYPDALMELGESEIERGRDMVIMEK